MAQLREYADVDYRNKTRAQRATDEKTKHNIHNNEREDER